MKLVCFVVRQHGYPEVGVCVCVQGHGTQDGVPSRAQGLPGIAPAALNADRDVPGKRCKHF